MVRFNITKPTTFLSALAIAMIATVCIVVAMEILMILYGEVGTIYVDVILLSTILIAIIIAPIMLWIFATKRLGYVWA